MDLAEKIAAASVLDVKYHEECIKKIIRTRTNTAEELKSMGFDVPDSSANFIFARPPRGIDAETLYLNLRAKGILVRYFKTPGINDRLRITIGTDDEMEKFIANVREEISNAKDS